MSEREAAHTHAQVSDSGSVFFSSSLFCYAHSPGFVYAGAVAACADSATHSLLPLRLPCALSCSRSRSRSLSLSPWRRCRLLARVEYLRELSICVYFCFGRRPTSFCLALCLLFRFVLFAGLTAFSLAPKINVKQRNHHTRLQQSNKFEFSAFSSLFG